LSRAVDVTLAEIRKVTTWTRYSGPTARIRIAKGLSWRTRSIAVNRVTQDVRTDLDHGVLYITSKRLPFDGSKKSTTISLSAITNFTVYTDALQVERERGKDQFFKWDGADSSTPSLAAP
jgi:hypothetical protein